MNTRLLCIDSIEDYELIDQTALHDQNIDVFFASRKYSKEPIPKNYISVSSFDYEALHSLCSILKPDYIVCFSEDLFVDIALIRQNLNIKGMSVATAKLLSHKNLMYDQIDGSFPYPKTTTIDKQSNFSGLKDILNASEIFIKPVNMGGSYETYHIKNDKEFDYFLANKKESLSTYVAQTYIDADLYHSELVICNGTVLFVSARKYSLPNHLMVSKNVPVFSLNIDEQDHFNKIKNASIEVIRLLGVNNGIFHTEFFMNDQGAIHFIETNARAPGIGLNRLYLNKLAISLETLLCFIVCGKNPPEFTECDDLFVCGYYPLRPGVVKAIIKPELDVANKWIIYVKPDDIIPEAKYMSKAAMFICWDKCIAKIDEATHLLAKHNVIEVY